MTDTDDEEITPSLGATANEIAGNETTRNQPMAVQETANDDNTLYIFETGEEKPFKCIFPKCTFHCVRIKRLKRHYNTHEKDLHSCSYCSYVSIHSKELRQHMLNEHPEKLIFKCKVCDCKFQSEENCSKHSKMHIGTYASPCLECEGK